MKILVVSDSHAGYSFMRRCIEYTAPDAIIHLGDYYRDGETMAEEYPHIPVYQVPGNCDMNRSYIPDPEIRLLELGGVRLYLTHGHRHQVKSTLVRLIADARAAKAQAVLFGHTHSAMIQREPDLLVLNPGAASWGGSAAILETHLGSITGCRLLYPQDVSEP